MSKPVLTSHLQEEASSQSPVGKPLVSIGLPTYNRASSLARAIESVLLQDYPNLELVISDNASTDETQELCSSFCQRDSRIRYIRQAKNQGATANFSTVLRQASGEYFMWLADDDWLDMGYISRCLHVMQFQPMYSLVCGDAKYYEAGGGTPWTGVRVNLLNRSRMHRVLDFYRQVGDNATFYGLYRRNQLLPIPLRDVLGGDWCFVAAVTFQGMVMTLSEVTIHRSMNGISQDIRALALRSGIPAALANDPYRVIAQNAYSDVLRSPVYKPLGRVSRLYLACCVFLILFKGVTRIRARLRLRSRWKSLWHFISM